MIPSIPIYGFEIDSYREQIQLMRSELKKIEWDDIESKTHFFLARSNRANFMVIGLCSLVEARMFEMAQEQESSFKLSDIRGQGITRLKIYLKRVDAIDFSELKNWDSFQSIYKIRNWIVHSYAGMVIKKDTTKLKEQFSKLNLSKYLVDGSRIQLEPDGLEEIDTYTT